MQRTRPPHRAGRQAKPIEVGQEENGEDERRADGDHGDPGTAVRRSKGNCDAGEDSDEAGEGREMEEMDTRRDEVDACAPACIVGSFA